MSDPFAQTSITRRRFIQLFVGLVGVTWTALTTYPVFRYLISGQKKAAATEDVKSVSLGPVADFPAEGGKNFQFGSQPALIVRASDGNFHAYNAVCTHLGCTVQYMDEKSTIWCACHGGKYDPLTGKNIAGPPPKPLGLLKVEVIDDNIVVSRA